MKKALLILVYVLSSNSVYADVTAKINITGELIEPSSCSFDASSYDVNFGTNILTTSVYDSGLSSTQYANDPNIQNVNYTMTCTGATNNEFKMQLVPGSVSPFSSNTVATEGVNATNLGVILLKDKVIYNVGTQFTFTPSTKPVLQAVLVKKAGENLQAGTFTASVNMVIENP